jgi:hypothetical protein
MSTLSETGPTLQPGEREENGSCSAYPLEYIPDAFAEFSGQAFSVPAQYYPNFLKERELMEKHRIFATSFASVYPLYIQKAERKNRTKEEVDEIIFWLTGYDRTELEEEIRKKTDFETFFNLAPKINPNASLIKGVVCGVRVEEIKDPLMRKIRYLDKLIDELAQGKKMEKILRNGG